MAPIQGAAPDNVMVGGKGNGEEETTAESALVVPQPLAVAQITSAVPVPTPSVIEEVVLEPVQPEPITVQL